MAKTAAEIILMTLSFPARVTQSILDRPLTEFKSITDYCNIGGGFNHCPYRHCCPYR
ncbi:hypothetical protein CCACVL1_04118 [Corchorus capsularis]|uniref:Uncharacterized protein n=1 Tax=Corchorus capsularis TaxID=210143 RepID=A0A1R3JUU2_COCAP|nr:hypothetical protein CCACVL1_04118 [Corchorus capsularis]